MTEGRQLGETPADRVDISGRLRAALRSGATAGLRAAVTTGLAVVVGLVLLDAACTRLAAHGSILAALVAFAFTGLTGALFAVYVVGVRAVGRGVIVGNEKAQLGLLVLEVTMSSADRGHVGAAYLQEAGARTRTAIGELNTQVEGNILTRWAARRVLRLVTRLVSEKVVESLAANRGDIPGTLRDLSGSVTSWLNAMVARWMRTQTVLACTAAAVISLLAAALLASS